MKLVDANLLLYAVNEDAPRHQAARGWLDDALSGTEVIGFAWVVLLAFIRLSTRPGLFSRPLTLDTAADLVQGWISQPAAVVVHPTPRHLNLLHSLLSPLGTGANLVSDAHLAALALEHGAEVVSFDADFARFQGVRWRAP